MLLLALYLAAFAQLPQVPTPAETPQIEQQQQSPEEDIEPSDESVPAEEIPTKVDNQIPEDGSAETDNGIEDASNVLSDWVIVFFTAILTLVAILQWRNSVIQGRIFRSTERAYIPTVRWQLVSFTPDQSLRFKYTAKNFGRTPAVVLKTAAASVYTPVGEPRSQPAMQVVDEGRLSVNSGSGLDKEVKVSPPVEPQLHEAVKIR